MFERKLWSEDLTQEDLERVTEINLHQVVTHLSRACSSSAQFFTLIENIAYFKAMEPGRVKELVKKVLNENEKLAPSKNELIEIYYRYQLSRRKIQKLCRVRDNRITEVMEEAKTNSCIKEPVLGKTELQIAAMLIDFFTDTANSVI